MVHGSHKLNLRSSLLADRHCPEYLAVYLSETERVNSANTVLSWAVHIGNFCINHVTVNPWSSGLLPLISTLLDANPQLLNFQQHLFKGLFHLQLLWCQLPETGKNKEKDEPKHGCHLQRSVCQDTGVITLFWGSIFNGTKAWEAPSSTQVLTPKGTRSLVPAGTRSFLRASSTALIQYSPSLFVRTGFLPHLQPLLRGRPCSACYPSTTSFCA